MSGLLEPIWRNLLKSALKSPDARVSVCLQPQSFHPHSVADVVYSSGLLAAEQYEGIEAGHYRKLESAGTCEEHMQYRFRHRFTGGRI